MEFRNDNFNLNKKGVGLKFTGKGLNDIFNEDNIYNSNGIGVQLIRNQTDNREIALIDTSNINNNLYSKLKISFTNSSINIKNLNEINQIQTLNFNNNLVITNNVGIGSTQPKTLLDVSGRISCDDINIGGIILNKDYLINIGASLDNITSGILKREYGGTGVSSFNKEQLIYGEFNQSPYLVWKDARRRLGVGNTDPLYTLDVAGGINAKSYKINGIDINNIFLTPYDLLLSSNDCFNNSYKTSFISSSNYANNVGVELINRFNAKTSDWTTAGSDIVYVYSKIGIGTNYPMTSLDVVGDINYTGNLKRNGITFKSFSGNYNDLSNLPQILWELSNGNLFNCNSANIGIGSRIPKSKLDVNGDINFTGDLRKNGKVINIFSGNFNDLSNIPPFAKVAYSGSFNDITEIPTLFNGDFNNLENKPNFYPTDWNSTISNIPTFFPTDWNISIKNRPIYLKTDWNTTIDNKPTFFDTHWNSNIFGKPTVFPADWCNIINKPNTFYCDWNSNIINKPEFERVAYTGQYSNLLNKPYIFSGLYRELKKKPRYARVAFTGNYKDLSNLPNLFKGDFSTLSNLPTNFQTDWNSTLLNIPYFSSVAYSGLYSDLIGSPIENWGENQDHIFSCNLGNVGIGNTNPQFKLDVKGTVNLTDVIKIGNNRNIINNNKPWGMYFAEDWIGTTLPDVSGNNRHATTAGTITKYFTNGNGATNPITYLTGGTSSTISFPSGSIPNNFTLLTLTRYNGGTRRRIIMAQSGNWLHGHYNGNRGVCHYDGWKSPSSSTGTQDNWLCCIGRNLTTTPNNIIVDGNGIGTASGGTSNIQLSINIGYYETSDWGFACVLIWDKHLTDNECFELNSIISNVLSFGGSFKYSFINNIDIYGSTYFNNDIYLCNINISNVFANSNDFIRTSNWVINGNNIYNVNSGCVGINNINPSPFYKLDVNGIINSSGYNITGNGGLFWSSYGNAGIGCASFNGEYSSSSLIGDMVIRSQEGKRLILQNGSNAGTLFIYDNKIGIGTNSPTSLLHLHNSNTLGEVKISLTDASTGTTSSDGFSIYKYGNDDGFIWNYENSALRFGSSNTERMCILGDGKIGIGTNNPTSLLHLHSSSTTGEVKISLTDASTGIGTTDGFALFKSGSEEAFIWNYENSSMRFGTNNLERICILTNGNVGIGTNNPSSILHLHSSNTSGEVKMLLTDASTGITATSGFSIIKSGNDEGYIMNYSNASIRFGTSNIERMCILNDGKIGIGTNSPTSLLHLHNSSTTEIKINLTDNSTGIGTTDGFSIFKSSGNDGYLWNYENNALRFGTNNTERICILNDGKIGIGTNNPSSILHLNNPIASGEVKILLTDASTGTTSSSGFSIYKTGSDEGFIWNYSNAPIRFGTSNLERMCILGDGKIGIGTNNPTSLLHLHNASGEVKISLTDTSTNSTTTDGFSIFKSSGNDGYLWNYESNALRFGTSNNERMSILANGNIGIGNNNPSYLLDVNGTINATSFIGDGSNLSNLNIGNLSTGTFGVNRGGTGLSNLTANRILVGNGTNAILQPNNLVWDNTNNRLGIGITIPEYSVDVSGNIRATSFIGNGSNITGLNASNISTGIISVSNGGTGLSNLSSNQLLIGNGTGALIQSANLIWDNTNNRLGIGTTPLYSLDVNGTINATNVRGNGSLLSNLSMTNISTGVFSVSRGGTGLSNLTANQILIGNGTGSLIQTSNLIWDNTNNRLGIKTSTPQYTLDVFGDVRATNLIGNGSNISNINPNNISSGVLSVSYGGTGSTNLTAGQILVGNGTNPILQSANLVWDNTNNRLGINKSVPIYNLDVVGDINFTGVIRQNGNIYNTSPTSSQWNSTSSNITYLSGNVGIGTYAPSTNLEVIGNIKCDKIYTGNNTFLTSKLLLLDDTSNGTGAEIIFNFENSTTKGAYINYNNNLMTFKVKVNATSSTNGYWFSGASFVGIGTNPEKGLPLKVASGTRNRYIIGCYFTTNTTIQYTSGSDFSNISAYFDNNIIVSTSVIVFSDIRIKNEINNINSKKSLELISKINPKTFKYIDFIKNGTKKNYGFIAQDIKEFIPEAVGYRKEIIPNVMKTFNINEDIIELDDDLSLSINDTIEIYDKENKSDTYKILEISSNHIKIDKKIEGDKCFIYGKEIDDFHILDKDTIFTINVSATQELIKKLKKQKKILKIQEEKIKNHERIIKERELKLKEQQEKIDLLFELLAKK